MGLIGKIKARFKKQKEWLEAQDYLKESKELEELEKQNQKEIIKAGVRKRRAEIEKKMAKLQKSAPAPKKAKKKPSGIWSWGMGGPMDIEEMAGVSPKKPKKKKRTDDYGFDDFNFGF